MTIWGYARCSTNEKKQNIEMQLRDLKETGATDETIYVEWESGSKEDRKELNKLFNAVKDYDTISVYSIDRISRSSLQFIRIINFIEEHHLKLIITQSGFVVDCTNNKMDIMTEALLKVISIFNELERKMICARVQSGVNNARAKGVKLGRPKTTYDTIPESFFRYLPKYQNKEINKSEFARLSNLSYPSIYKYLEIICKK